MCALFLRALAPHEENGISFSFSHGFKRREPTRQEVFGEQVTSTSKVKIANSKLPNSSFLFFDHKVVRFKRFDV